MSYSKVHDIIQRHEGSTERAVQRIAARARKEERETGRTLVAVAFDSYESNWTGKRGGRKWKVEKTDGTVDAFLSLGQTLLANAKEATKVTLFFKDAQGHKERRPEVRAHYFEISMWATSSELTTKMLEFMQHRDVVTVSVDSYMPTSLSGSTGEVSYGVVFYRETASPRKSGRKRTRTPEA